MKKEIALHCLKAYSQLHNEMCEDCPIYGETGDDHCFEDALNKVIKILEKEPCEDCISRKELIQWLKTEFNPIEKTAIDYDVRTVLRVIEHLRSMKSVQPIKKGK